MYPSYVCVVFNRVIYLRVYLCRATVHSRFIIFIQNTMTFHCSRWCNKTLYSQSVEAHQVEPNMGRDYFCFFFSSSFSFFIFPPTKTHTHVECIWRNGYPHAQRILSPAHVRRMSNVSVTVIRRACICVPCTLICCWMKRIMKLILMVRARTHVQVNKPSQPEHTSNVSNRSARISIRDSSIYFNELMANLLAAQCSHHAIIIGSHRCQRRIIYT